MAEFKEGQSYKVEAWGTSMVFMTTGSPIDYEVETTMARTQQSNEGIQPEQPKDTPAEGSIDFNNEPSVIAARYPLGLERNDPYGAPDPRFVPFEVMIK